MSYLQVMYNDREKSTYPKQLAEHLLCHYYESSEGKMLDVGCGDGTFTEAFRSQEIVVEGIDEHVGCPAIQERRKYSFEKDHIPYEDNTFDFVFCKSVIEHINNTEFFLSEIKRVLKPSGVAIIMTPAWEYNYKDFYHDHTHVKPFHLRGLRDACKITGFSSVEVEYFYQLPEVWERFFIKIFACLTRWMVPDILKFKDAENKKHNIWIRFSKEVMLLAKVKK